MMSHPLLPRGLYGITPQSTDFALLARQIAQAAAGGMRILQWRQKELSPDLALKQAAQTVHQCRELGVLFIINDNVDLALSVNADGVHLGKDDGDLLQARTRLGADKIIGCSCYNELKRAETAMRQGADYVAFGAVFSSSVKPDAVHAPLELFEQAKDLRAAIAEKPVALVAIGGITTQNARQVVQAGADNIAVIGGLFEAQDIQDTAARFAACF